MSYVVYNTETTRLFKSKMNKSEFFPTAAAAKRSLTVAARNGRLQGYVTDYTISTVEEFRKVEKMETKTSLFGGTFTQSVNTPLCCDPSSETYWSM